MAECGLFLPQVRLLKSVLEVIPELFRDRGLSGDSAGRTILSFATASMLPKLQDLHDARRAIFILGTNYLRNIDRAIRREGRFDAALLFDRPDHAAREQIAADVLREKKGLDPGATLSAADQTLARQITDRSAGWMIKQIRAFGEGCADAGKVLASNVSIADYADWCATDGPLELRAAGLDERTINDVLERWKPLLPAAPPAAGA
jgi:SpoVK/Ycf46/Vps4 family AAA+-type ATPase